MSPARKPGPRPAEEGEEQPRRFYGRRRGRPLRPQLARLVEERLPAHAVEIPASGRLDPAALFDPPKGEYWLEIGFGGGEHLVAQAKNNADVGLIGAEVFLNGIATALRAIEADSLANVRLYGEDARDLLDALPDASLRRVFILFPDPWPKLRHHRRRIVSDDSLARLAELLADDGELRLATDDEDYLCWMLEHLHRQPAFEWTARRADDWRRRPADWPSTRYEQKAIEQGRKPSFLRYRRLPRAGSVAGGAFPADLPGA